MESVIDPVVLEKVNFASSDSRGQVIVLTCVVVIVILRQSHWVSVDSCDICFVRVRSRPHLGSCVGVLAASPDRLGVDDDVCVAFFLAL